MRIKITDVVGSAPQGKLADAELIFGPETPQLDGLKLIGFGVWASRHTPRGINVTFPARSYSVNGERRSFALLRPLADVGAHDRIKALIIEAYEAYAEAIAS